MTKTIEDFVKWQKAAQNLRLLQEDYATNDENLWVDGLFAKFLGLSPSTFSNLVNGTRLSIENAIQVCDVTGVTLDWFVLGKGDRYPQDGESDRVDFRTIKSMIEELPEAEQLALAQHILALVQSS